MLVGVGIGPGDPELLTLKAVRILKEADEVIAPGMLAAEIIEQVRKPRIVEFPMGKSDTVIKKLSKELADRCIEENIAFVALGDIMFYSTFMHIAKEVKRLNSKVEIECIPGIPSFSCVFDKTITFCNSPFAVLTSKDIKKLKSGESLDNLIDKIIVLKATHPVELNGYKIRAVAKRMYMDSEDIALDFEKPPDFNDYFTVVLMEKLDK